MTLTPSQAVLEALHDYKARIPKREGRPDASEREHMAVLEEAARRCEAWEMTLQIAASRLEWCAGLLPSYEARNLASEWAEETRAAIAPPEGMNQEER